MSIPFRGVPLRARAIALMKECHGADAVHAMFVGEGQDPDEVRAVLTELVALQHEAAAMDPARLRGEAQWMFLRGASVDDVVRHFVQAGVAEAHARPEAERIHESVRRLRPCQRCGTPTAPDKLVMDLSGFTICPGCNLRDEIGRSESRGMARELEAVGIVGGLGGMLAASAIADAVANNASAIGQTSQPFCGSCRIPSGIHISRVAPHLRAGLDPRAEWVCGQCGAKIA